MRIFLTFDVEEFYDAELIRSRLAYEFPKTSSLEFDIDLTIDLCSQNNIKATYFILGKVAREKPQIVRKLSRAGHEIASHSYNHNLIYDLSPEAFKKDLIKSKKILEDLTGAAVHGFRAPSWSVNKTNAKWFYSILEEENFSYSSSVYPGKTFLYGFPEAQTGIHQPFIEETQLRIYEIPQAVIRILHKKIGFSGGFYFRAFPKMLLQFLIHEFSSKDRPFFIYLHPYEILQEYRLKGLPFFVKFIQNWHTGNTLNKLETIVNQYANCFCTMEEFVRELH